MSVLSGKRVAHCCFLGTILIFFAGCSSNYVVYNRGRQAVPASATGEDSKVYCDGSIEVYRNHGVLHPIGAEGPWWSHKSYYGIYFKHGPASPSDFYLAVSPDRRPVKTCGVRGAATVNGRYLLIRVEYKDESGRWNKLPINGHRKIDRIYPDDAAWKRKVE